MAFRLPRLPDSFAIVTSSFKPTALFIRWWQSVVQKIEEALAALEGAIAAVAAAQAAADNANAAAAVATAAAADAQDATDAVTRENNLVNSYVDGTPPILTATDAGANVTIAVAAHTRVYGDGSTLAITGGNVTGQAYSVPKLYIYYVDATRADTTPTFLATTDPTVAAQTGDTHLIGSTPTPAAAAPPETGDSVAPPGIGNLYEFL